MKVRRVSVLPSLIVLILLLGATAVSAGECPYSGTEYTGIYKSAAGLPRCGGGSIGKWTPCEVCMISNLDYTEEQAYMQSYPGSGTGLQPHARFTYNGTPPVAPIDVEGFFDGLDGTKAIFRVRFTPTTSAGTWSFALTSTDDGLKLSDSLTSTTSSSKGFLRRDGNARTLVWDNNARPFLWGQTYYQVVNQARSKTDGRWHPAIVGSKGYGMNKIRLLVSPWADDPQTGIASKAFQKLPGSNDLNRNKLDIENWRALDDVVEFLTAQQMVADLILFHDGNLTTSPFAGARPANPQQCTIPDDTARLQNERYTRYIMARYAAFSNVIWTLSNEYQLVTGNSTQCNAPWTQLGCLIRGCSGAPPADPWMGTGTRLRALSNHNNINLDRPDRAINGSYPCFEFFSDGWANHLALQTRRANSDTMAGEAVSRNGNVQRTDRCAGLTANRRLPIIDDEYFYLGEDDNADQDRKRHRQAMWAIAASGGFGSTGSTRGPKECGGEVCQPTFQTNWQDETLSYGDIRALVNFFNGPLGFWWEFDNTSRLRKLGDTRLYGMARGNEFLAYVVRGSATNTDVKARFEVQNLPIGTYSYNYYEPYANGRERATQTKNVSRTGVNQWTPFPSPKLPGWPDLVARVYQEDAISVAQTVWVWDALPAGAVPSGAGEGWNWIDDEPVPIGDALAHQSNSVAGMHQHFFTGATETLSVAAGETLFAYVYLEPTDAPTEVMLQWNVDGSWEHRAYWGANQIGWGVNGTNSRRSMGALPQAGEWVRLEVPASLVGLEGRTVNGMAFTLFGGKATWDDAGKTGEGGPVCEQGAIVQQPQPQTVIPGGSATLSVAVSGTGPFQYQFYQSPVGTYSNPIGISTATVNTGPLYTTKQYWAEIIDNCTQTFLASDQVTVTVQCTAAPTITTQPISYVRTPGQPTTLSVAASQGVSYQWYQGTAPSTASPISGANGTTLPVSPQSTTSYWVRVTNGCGTADSVTATICVLPAITAQPTPRTINPGQTTTLGVSAINAASYQWYSGNAPSTAAPISGGTGSSVPVSPPVTTNYWVRITNSCGSVDSTTVTVTVAPVPSTQIMRIQSRSVLANSQTSITANWSQPTQAGTFLVAVISAVVDVNPSINFTPPAGWSHAVTSEWTNVKLAIYYLPNNAGARTSETFTVSPGYHDMSLYVLEYSGIVATNPLDKTAIAGNDTNDGYVETGYTANTAQPKELVITALTAYAQTELTAPSTYGYTEVYDQSMLYHLTTAMYEKITTASGSYGHWAQVYVPAQWVGAVATFKGAN
jgi:hypothetical protein